MLEWYIGLAFAVKVDNWRGAKWMCPYKYMGGYEAKSPTFFKNAREDLENLRRFFELSPSEDFEEGMFSKRMSIISRKAYFCSSRGCANGDFGSVLTRKSWVSALIVPHIFPKRFSLFFIMSQLIIQGVEFDESTALPFAESGPQAGFPSPVLRSIKRKSTWIVSWFLIQKALFMLRWWAIRWSMPTSMPVIFSWWIAPSIFKWGYSGLHRGWRIYGEAHLCGGRSCATGTS